MNSSIYFEINVCNNNSYFVKRNPINKISNFLGYTPSYEIIGDIAIVNREEKNIQKVGNYILNYYKSSINTVLQSLGPVYGEFRVRKFCYICGINKKKTLYKENGCLYHIDLENAYFTQHLATERQNILKYIHENDIIIDMFCGVGPYSILIAKKVKVNKIISIDKNPIAIELLKKNIEINKAKNIEVIEMDARNIKDIYPSFANHVIMNLPQNSIDFIESAIVACKKNGFVHYYSMSSKNEKSIFMESIDKIKQKALLLKKNIKIINTKVIRSYAPHQYNIRIDIQILN